MKIRNLFFGTLLLALLWSCGKDDSPTPEPKPAENNAPKVEAQSFTVAEDISDATIIGTVKATDEDQDELTFSIEDNDLFEIDATGKLSLKSGQTLDFETKAEHIVKVSVSDGTDDAEANITITVTNVIEGLAEDPDSFVTLWNIPEDNFEIIIGTNPDYEYNYTIDWGDGTQEELTIQNPSHTYTSTGEYKVSIQGDFPAIKMGQNDLINIEGLEVAKSLIGLEQWGIIVWKNFNNGFANCVNMEYHATDIPNLQNVEDMSGMFASFSYGELDSGEPSVFNGDLSNWDVSNVTNMNGMFVRAELFNSDLSGWDVSNVIDMSGIFALASSFNADLSNWSVSNVTNMSGMFSHAYSFTSDLSNWNVSKVTNMGSMFASATTFNADLSDWDVSNVTNMSSMFSHASTFDADISTWNVSNVTDMSHMFSFHTTFNGDLSGWDVSNVTDMRAMFTAAESFNSDIGGWNVSNVTNMDSMFADAHTFNSDISEWDVSSVTDMTAMFADAESFNVNIGGWDVSKVSNMLAMFVEAAAFDQNLGGWNIESATLMNIIFSNSGMSAENYGATLIGWSNLENTPQGIALGAENIEYCLNSEGATARGILVNDYGWTINGDVGIDCN
ncbi:BspA family leucine-rich repeat surface protein [Flagellimonas crocea]|uniref:BspA family leucine-rich repeat surface protein n=1 Tax=Flagellimonas crocea TaxID=3067311 RepID=UPI00296FADC8|nr:BspA family leucine-rich repeat surface protein [Muricauda sp. DH64]